MKSLHVFSTVRVAVVAICASVALLCASCASPGSIKSEKKTPDDLGALYTQLGTEALLREDFVQAVSDLRKAISYNDKNTVAHNHLALAYYGLGNKTGAREELEKAVKIDPNNSDAWINKGRMAEDEGKYPQARQFYGKALENLEFKPRHRALTNLAQLELRDNRVDEARKLLYQSLQINPEYCLSHFLLGTIYARENNMRRAAESFGKSVVSTCTGNIEAHYRLGLAHMKLKQYPKARSEFMYLVENFPESRQAKQAGEQLRNIP